MEHIKCDQCGANDHEKVAQQTDLIHNTTTEVFIVVRCLQCGLHYTNPRPNPQEIEKYYSISYGFHRTSGLISALKGSFLENFRDWLANFPLSIYLSFIPFYSRFLAKSVKPKIEDPVLKYVEKNSKKSFLDIGCGSGKSAHFWGPSGSLMRYKKSFDVYGVEPNIESRNFLNSKGITCWEHINEIEKEHKFNLIRMNWSLEHVHSPREYFMFISDHLSSGGKAFIMVPNNEGLLYKLNQNCLELPVHLYHFSKQDIKKYAQTFDLEIDDFITFSYPEMYQVAATNGFISEKFRLAASLAKAHKSMDFIEAIDDMGWGTDMIVSLKKTTL